MYRILFLYLFYFTAFGQTPPKYPLIVQNLRFDHSDYSSLVVELRDNTARLETMLQAQGFPKKNITTQTNLTAADFRKVVSIFTDSLPKGAVVVVYLGSHGLQLPDNSGDEDSTLTGDRFDEVFITTDSPGSTALSSEAASRAGTKPRWDSSKKAIYDDEIKRFNGVILNRIGSNGHYLFLADFCNSAGASKGDGKWQLERVKVMPTPSIGSSPIFVGLMASSGKVGVPTPREKEHVGYFIQSLDYAIHCFKSCPTYSQLYNAFSKKMTSFSRAFPDNGKPGFEASNMQKIPTIVATKLLFNGTWKLDPLGFGNIFWNKTFRDFKGIPQDSIFSKSHLYEFNAPNSHLYDPLMQVEVWENEKYVGEGVVDTVKDSSVKIRFMNSFQPDSIAKYSILPSTKRNNSLTFAKKELDTINTKLGLRSILRKLSIENDGISVENCLNNYTVRSKGVLDTVPCRPFDQTTVYLGDNLTIKVHIQDTLYYFTILDVTEKNGLVNCFIDTVAKKEIGFYKNHISKEYNEINIFRSKATPPLTPAKSALWVLVTDTPIDDELFRVYLIDNKTSTQKNIVTYAQKEKLWDILQHIIYFKEINYEVASP